MLVDFLNRAYWYQTIAPHDQELVMSTAQLLEIGTGECLVEMGQYSMHWYGLAEGLLQMYLIGSDGSATTLYCMQKDEWGGDGSLLKGKPMQYELRALVPSEVCLIPKKTFDELRANSITFNQCLCDIMNKRMGVFVSMLAATRLFTPEMRVALALRMITHQQFGNIAEQIITQHDLALISGLSRQRVNKAITALRKYKIILSEPKCLALKVDLENLQHYVAKTG